MSTYAIAGFQTLISLLGIFLVAFSPASHLFVEGGGKAALAASIVGFFFLVALLMFVSGLPLQERPGAKKRYEKGLNYDAYMAYCNRTSILFFFPPSLYVRLPTFIKRTLFLEFPIYVFDPAKHSDSAKGQSGAEEGAASTNGTGRGDKMGNSSTASSSAQ